MSYNRREKRPEIDEELCGKILSRLFGGDDYIVSPKVDSEFLGYLDGIACKVYVFTNMFILEQLKKELSATKFGNKAMNTLFATRGLRCSTQERINFDSKTCVSVMYDNESVIFHFWYRTKNKAA